jgi:hypothetical protein
MKNLMNKDTQRTKKRKVARGPKNLVRLTTLQDFKKVVGDEKERLVVVRWYAPWCKVRNTLLSLGIIVYIALSSSLHGTGTSYLHEDERRKKSFCDMHLVDFRIFGEHSKILSSTSS